jgi:hypothetical protein
MSTVVGAGAPVGRRTAADEGRCTAGADDGTVPGPRVTVGEAQDPCGMLKTLETTRLNIFWRSIRAVYKFYFP